MSKVRTGLISSAVVAIIAEFFLMYIIYFNPHKITPLLSKFEHMNINMVFNSLSAIFITAGIVAIRKFKCETTHKIFIHMALASSAVFLVNYILYHLSVGHVSFNNTDLRPFYLFVLISHLVCSFLALPLVFATYTMGILGERSVHKMLALPTALIWLYVSITGVVLIYLLKYYHQWT